MREIPILYSGPMIRALIARQKSVTRRVSRRWLRVKAGDRLWVRETWAPSFLVLGTDTGECEYRATQRRGVAKWTPSIHMPRWASRITLEATEDARLVRIGDIDDADAVREGAVFWAHERVADGWAGLCADAMREGRMPNRDTFVWLWESIHGGWQQDLEVVRIAFKVVEVRP
jgi:hypothetical protein